MEQQELDFHLLATMRPKVYVPKQHPLAGRAKVSMEYLAPYVYSHYFQGIDSSRDRFFSEELVEDTAAKNNHPHGRDGRCQHRHGDEHLYHRFRHVR